MDPSGGNWQMKFRILGHAVSPIVAEKCLEVFLDHFIGNMLIFTKIMDSKSLITKRFLPRQLKFYNY